MAERKTKTATEEVVVEKRFCKNCGKELKEGEVCDCTAKEAPKATGSSITINTGDLKELGLHFLNTIKNMFVHPASTVDEEVEEHDMKMGMLLLVVMAITVGLYVMGGFKSIIASIGSFADFNINDAVSIPYFKVFIYVTLINFIVAFIPITVAFLTNKIFKGESLSYKKCISLYATSMAPTIVSNLLMALLYAVNILSGLGAIIGVVISLICVFNFIVGFVRLTKIKENHQAYALTTLTVVYAVISVIVSVLLLGSLLSDVYKDIKVNDRYNDIYDFGW